MFKILKQLKTVFVSPKKRYYIGDIIYGTPYFYPRNFNPKIIEINTIKNKPKNNRTYNFDFLGLNIALGYPIVYKKQRLGWKDKYNTPRMEWTPAIYLFFFKWQFCIFWESPDDDNDLYWEMVLWWLEYSNQDIIKAEETWGWTYSGSKISTWNNNYIKNYNEE